MTQRYFTLDEHVTIGAHAASHWAGLVLSSDARAFWRGRRYTPACVLEGSRKYGGLMFKMLRMTGKQDDGAGLRTSPGKLFFIVMLVVAALFVFSGCGAPGSTQAKPTPTLTVQQILDKAQKAQLTDETFTMTMQGTASGTTLNVTGDGKGTENPARMAMTLSMEVSGTTLTMDMVIDMATNTTYTRITAPESLASKTWTKATDTSSGIPTSDLQLTAQYGKLTNAKLIGSEPVNGVNTYHIQGGIPSTGGTVDVYVKQSDYLPVKMVVQSTGDTALQVTIIYTAVNTGVTIDLPTT